MVGCSCSDELAGWLAGWLVGLMRPRWLRCGFDSGLCDANGVVREKYYKSEDDLKKMKKPMYVSV